MSVNLLIHSIQKIGEHTLIGPLNPPSEGSAPRIFISSTALRMRINTFLANSSGVASWFAPRAEPQLPNESGLFLAGDVKNGERGVVALSGSGNVGERATMSTSWDRVITWLHSHELFMLN